MPRGGKREGSGRKKGVHKPADQLKKRITIRMYPELIQMIEEITDNKSQFISDSCYEKIERMNEND